jgi:chromosome segregation ATPase
VGEKAIWRLPNAAFGPMLVLMNNKGPILVLLVVAVGLGIALIVVNKEAADQARDAASNLAVFSNTVVSDKKLVAELQTVNQTLETNLATTRSDFSNKLALTEANLRATEATLEKAEAEAKATAKAQAESNAVLLAQRDQKISELESQNGALDQEAASLRLAITNLDTRIAATQTKLAKSEGDRAFLTKELKLLKAEKEDMENRFNSLTDLREQLRKLKIETSLSRRLDRMRKGIDATFKDKGTESPPHPSPTAAPTNGSGVNVELREGGGVKIQMPPSTNAPPK